MKKIGCSLTQIGYLYYIDKYDFDFVIILSKDKLSKLEIANIIKERTKNYGAYIVGSEYRLYEGELPFDYEPIIDLETWPVINLANFNLKKIKKPIVTKTKDFRIEMPITKINKLEIIEKEFLECANHLFHYNGAITLIDKNNLEKIKSLIKEIEENFSKNIS